MKSNSTKTERHTARELARTAARYEMIGKHDIADAMRQEAERHWNAYRSKHQSRLPEPKRQIVRRVVVIREDGDLR